MRKDYFMMGMPVAIHLADTSVDESDFDAVIAYFNHIDETFSTYKTTSEISRLNDGLLNVEEISDELREVFSLAKETKELTYGYFDIERPAGGVDPSGLVKGLMIWRGAEILRARGYKNFYVEIAGDIQTHGLNPEGRPWRIGIRNPLKDGEIVKALHLSDRGVATSGTYIRGDHIYDPLAPGRVLDEIVSLTVIGPNIYEADRFATAAFAMGRDGIKFIAGLNGFEGYMIDKNGLATMTPGFERYTQPHV